MTSLIPATIADVFNAPGLATLSEAQRQALSAGYGFFLFNDRLYSCESGERPVECGRLEDLMSFPPPSRRSDPPSVGPRFPK